MAHDPVRLADTRAWITRAAADLRAARHGMRADPPLFDDIAFHCQQAVEKCLKALLAWNDVAFRKTHSLEELGEACLSIDDTLRPLIDRAVPLSEYAWKFRYPGEPEGPTRDDVEAALAVAHAVWDAVTRRVPQDLQNPDQA